MVRKKEVILPDMEKLYLKRLLLFSGGVASGLNTSQKKGTEVPSLYFANSKKFI